MSDLESKIQNILSSPDGMEQVLEMAKSLGLSGNSESNANGDSFPQLSGLFDGLNPEQLGMVMSFIDDYRDESDRRFHMLHALREYVKPEDVLHLEKAKQIVKLTKVAKHALHSIRGREQDV